MEPEALGWRPLFRSWLNTLPDPLKASPLAGSLLTTLFEQFVDPVCLHATSDGEVLSCGGDSSPEEKAQQ